jgi:hypothetical protein
MINHFLKLGGVNTVKEFYKKFPTEEHFDQHIYHMKYGGMYAYAPGGETGDESTIPEYKGVSIVDFLKSKGKASEISKRKELAEKLGITDYTGKPGQNIKLLSMLRESPNLLDDYQAGPYVNVNSGTAEGYTKKTSKDSSINDQQPVKKNDDGTPISPIDLKRVGANVIGGTLGALTGYGIYKFLNRNKLAAHITELLGLPEGHATKLISEASGDGAKILQNIQNRGSYTVDELRNLMKLGYGSNAQKIASSLPKNTSAIPGAVSQVSNIQKTIPLNSGEEIGKVIAQNSNKYQWLKNAGQGMYDVAKAGYTGARKAKMVKDIAKLSKFFGRLEYGGDIDNFRNLHNQSQYNYYETGGEENDPSAWHIAGYQVPEWVKTGVQIADPTGISSYGDAYRSINQAIDNPSWGTIGEAALNSFSALPVIGKVGKGAKIAKEVSEINKIGKFTKGLEKIKKVTNSPVFTAIKRFDNYNPIGAGVMGVTSKIAEKTPKGVQKVLNIGSDLNRNRRWMQGAGVPIKAADSFFNVPSNKMGGQPCYNCGGSYARGGQTLHPGGDGTYYQGNFFDDGGTFIPEYGDAAYGQLPQYEMGKAMYGSGVMELGGPTYSDVTQYNHQEYVPAFDWMQDGGSPLYSTQGQPLRNFMNTVGYTPGGWMPNHFELPPVGRYDDGGMAPQMPAQPQMGPPDQQQGPVGAPGQGGGGIDPQQVMQIVAQKLQQGEQPQQVMQELVQAGVPQNMAQQIIQQVMQQLQASQGQQAGEEMMENPEQQGPQEELEEGQSPQAMYGLGMKYGGSTNKKGKFAKNYKVGGEYEMSNSDIQKLIAQGYKLQYL